jgi:serine/threonine protein kinase/tetratricopeptide (TPR) repeat protein
LAGECAHESDALFRELLARECAFRQTLGEPIKAEEYVERFPDYSAIVVESFDSLDDSSRLLLPLREDTATDFVSRAVVQNDNATGHGDTRNRNITAQGIEDVDGLELDDDNVLISGAAATLDRATSSANSIGSLENGRFEILGELGRGGMGVVYRAYDRKRAEIVALKTMHRLSPSSVYRFKKEFRALADVAHPNLVTLHELTSDGYQWSLTMELVEGVDFLDFVRNGPSSSARSDFADYSTEVAGFDGFSGYCGMEQEAIDIQGRAFSGANGLSSLQLGRLRHALKQLAAGLTALHESGVLHRDIKPNNVLVTDRGRVVLLDFGLAAELTATGVHESTEAHIMGTASYMAPEQAAGLPLTLAADWYSVGVMLYEALTGRLPFLGGSLEVIKGKQDSEPPAPRDLDPECPEDLNTLCVDLMMRDPIGRPGGGEVLARLEGSSSEPGTGAPLSVIAGHQTPFVGREHQLSSLRDAFLAVQEGRTVAVFIQGRSGVGKTAMVQHFLDGLTEQGEALVLVGRCYERESVPYKALDNVVDALARYLRRLPGHEAQALLPRDILSLTRVFPVLRRVDAVAAAPQRSYEVPDPQELRRRAFAALRDLLARIGDRCPLILWIDDLQWGDTDSTALLVELLRPPDPPVILLLATYRSEDAETSAVFRGLADIGAGDAKGVQRRDLAVLPLAPREAQELAASLLDSDETGIQTQAEIIARESGGSPFYVAELVRYLQTRRGATANVGLGEAIALDRVLWDRIMQLPERIRVLLEVIAVAGRPVGAMEACQAARLDGDRRGALSMLGLGKYRLIRSTGANELDRVETYHDRVRETVVAHLTPTTLASHHHHLAEVLSASGQADPEILAIHYEGAGEHERAGDYYVIAAGEATKSLAFDRAVTLYRRALDLRPQGSPGEFALRVDLGGALASAGRGPEAAAQFLSAAEMGPSQQGLDLQCKAATQLLISGNIDEGLRVLDVVLDSLGMTIPRTQLGAIASVILRRLQIRLRGYAFRTRKESDIDASHLRKIDTCNSVATGLGLVDFVRGLDYHSRHLLLSLKAGEPHRIVKAMAMEAGQTSVTGAFNNGRSERLLRAAQSAADRLNDQFSNAFLLLARGWTDYFAGQWVAARTSLGSAEERFLEHCTGAAWELDTTRTFALWSLLYMGEVSEMSGRLPVLLREAEMRGDLYFLMNLSTYITSFVMACHDEPGAARDRLARITERWSQRGFHVQHHNILLATTLLNLYEGHAHAAWNYISERLVSYRQSLMLHIQQVRIDVTQLEGRSALAVAAISADPRPFLAVARGCARRLERERTRWGVAHARAIQAGSAAIRGDHTKANALLNEAAISYAAADMRLYAAAARRRLGHMVGGDEGRELIAKADKFMRSQGVRKPGRITAMYIPGFADTK